MNWISVKDKLPHKFKDVLAFDSVFGISICCIKEDPQGIYWEKLVEFGSEPSHWMPLPEPPEIT